MKYIMKHVCKECYIKVNGVIAYKISGEQYRIKDARGRCELCGKEDYLYTTGIENDTENKNG